MNRDDHSDAPSEWVNPADESAQPISARDPERQSPTRARGGRSAKVIASVAAAMVIGGSITFALDRQSGSSANASNPSAVASSSIAASSSAGGPLAGEQHILGTVAGKSASSVTVKSSAGTSATYTVNATTEIVRNGQAATLADIQVGDPVLVHVYPSSSGQMLVERLLAGTSANDIGHGDGLRSTPSTPETTTTSIS
jgi:hypothetical protein